MRFFFTAIILCFSTSLLTLSQGSSTKTKKAGDRSSNNSSDNLHPARSNLTQTEIKNIVKNKSVITNKLLTANEVEDSVHKTENVILATHTSVTEQNDTHTSSGLNLTEIDSGNTEKNHSTATPLLNAINDPSLLSTKTVKATKPSAVKIAPLNNNTSSNETFPINSPPLNPENITEISTSNKSKDKNMLEPSHQLPPPNNTSVEESSTIKMTTEVTETHTDHSNTSLNISVQSVGDEQVLTTPNADNNSGIVVTELPMTTDDSIIANTTIMTTKDIVTDTPTANGSVTSAVPTAFSLSSALGQERSSSLKPVTNATSTSSSKRIRLPPGVPPNDASTTSKVEHITTTTTTTQPTTTTSTQPTTTTSTTTTSTQPTTTTSTTTTTTQPTTTTTTQPTTTTKQQLHEPDDVLSTGHEETVDTSTELSPVTVVDQHSKNIVQTVKDFGKNIVDTYGPGKTAGVVAVVLFVIIIFFCCLCRCRKRRKYARLRKLQNYGQEKDFLLTNKSNGKYQSDRVTLLDESSEDEF